MPKIVQLVEMPDRPAGQDAEVVLAAELDDDGIVTVDRWFTDERPGHVHPSTFPALVGTDIRELRDRVHEKDVALVRSWV